MRFNESVVIRRSPEDVFEFLADVCNIPTWASGVSKVEIVRSGNGSPLRYRVSSEFLGRKQLQTFEMREHVEDARIVYESIESDFPIKGSFDLDRQGSSTLLTHITESQPGSFFKMSPDALRSIISKRLQENLENVRGFLET